MEFEEAADRLYGVDPEEFIPARAALVAEAKAAGDRPLATRIGALKKPTRSAWLVNLLRRESLASLEDLNDVAGRLLAAHSGGDLAALRAVSAQRQKVADTLTKAAVSAGATHEYTATEPVRLEVHGTLASAAADPEVLNLVLTGRVVKAQVYSGFGFPLGAMPAPTAPAPSATAQPATSGKPEEPANTDPELARQAAQQAISAATDALIEARGALKAAEAAELEAGQGLDRASQEVADLRKELRAAEDAEQRARAAATQAGDDVHEARTGVQQAEASLAQAARALGDLS